MHSLANNSWKRLKAGTKRRKIKEINKFYNERKTHKTLFFQIHDKH